MTETQRKAMQQALEALEDAKALLNSKYSADTMWFAKEITALRAALAEPEPEPVAWIGKNVFRCLAFIEPQDDSETPLYTTPPARRPLTLEEIMDAVRDADLDWHAGWSLGDDAPNRYITLIRVVERKITGGSDE